MPVRYKVTVTPGKKENLYTITWHNMETHTEKHIEQPSTEITPKDVETLWQKPQHQLTIGHKLFHFLDGNKHLFQHALDNANAKGETLEILLCPCKHTADWPFELLSNKNNPHFLTTSHLHLVRCVSDWGKEKNTPPNNQPLKLLFMACSAQDVEPELNFEREEETIFHVTQKLAVDIEAEDSGSLEGLREQLTQNRFDVIHISGHAYIDKTGHPYFIMENETGFKKTVSPRELWRGALIENPPRLLFLSGCHTGQTPTTPDTPDTGMVENPAAVSFARRLVEEYHVPAVLGWGRSVGDEQATHAEQVIYDQLSRGRSVTEAVMRAREELLAAFPESPNPAWPLLRLFGGGESMAALVTPGQKVGLAPRRMRHVYLEQSRVKVLAEGFVGRRRQLQQGLRVLKDAHGKVGVVLLGAGGLGKSCLAGKICERFKDHTLIVVHGRLDSVTLAPALKDAFVAARDEEGKAILGAKKEMTEKLENLCASCFKERNYLLLFDDFEQNIEGADKGEPGPLFPAAEALVRVLLRYLTLSGKMTHLVVTSRYGFSVPAEEGGGGVDLAAERLDRVYLTGFGETERLKKARELKHILNYGDWTTSAGLLAAGRGNPRLMEWLDVLVGEMAEAEVVELLAAAADKREDFIREHVVRELLHRGGEDLARFLQWLSIYRIPVGPEGVRHVGEKAGLADWKGLLDRGLGLSLLEHDRARGSYGVTPLLREELEAGLENGIRHTCHEAAFVYYREECGSLDSIDPIRVEEWIYHALACGEDDIASRQGGELVNHLWDGLAYRESLRVGEWVLSEKKRKNRELSTEHYAFLLNALAVTIYTMGDNRKAIGYYEQALTICKDVYGETHSEVAARLNNLGAAWYALGDHRKAIGYYEQALIIWKDVYVKTHSLVATGLNNLGAAWHALGEHRKAIGYYEQALTINREVSGDRHPDVAVDLNNLGAAWKSLGDPQKAIGYYEQALTIDQEVFGDRHPTVASGLNNLGEAWRALGDPKKAVNYCEQALTIDREVFGDRHPDVAGVLNNLGMAWYDLDDKRKAIGHFEQALTIDQEVSGDRHPTVAIRLNNLGAAWSTLGDPKKAIGYYEQALTINQEVFGDRHPNIAGDLNNLGTAYFALGQRETAKGYFEKAYGIWKRFYGDEHPQTKNTAGWLENC